jgi:hypothetical protein
VRGEKKKWNSGGVRAVRVTMGGGKMGKGSSRRWSEEERRVKEKR